MPRRCPGAVTLALAGCGRRAGLRARAAMAESAPWQLVAAQQAGMQLVEPVDAEHGHVAVDFGAQQADGVRHAGLPPMAAA